MMVNTCSAIATRGRGSSIVASLGGQFGGRSGGRAVAHPRATTRGQPRVVAQTQADAPEVHDVPPSAPLPMSAYVPSFVQPSVP
ncbi:hypothetical protein K7X08_006831 [Anisodus acutangulus]|uniref:Uncharacterized protein n=1 Tax=Anisodus acutangulus TaxID=402998 RepID=A0A9Q1QXP8_9SOLA|nr:hypothetical protein K7X08_006831 [Anisodus acutangulus]